MDKSDIDFSRGDEDIVFIHTDLDMEQISEEENPKKTLEEEMAEQGLTWENAQLIGLFQDEFSLMLGENAEISFEDETVYP